MQDVDKSNMQQMLMDFPKQFLVGFGAANDFGIEFAERKFKNIIVAGMGGSALPGDLLETFAKEIKLNVPVFVHRNYGLPRHTSEDSLVVVISYSGNTEEAVSAYEVARKMGSAILTITSGGKLKEYADKDSVGMVDIPQGLPPRLAVGYQFSALVALVQNAGLCEPQDLNISRLSQTLDVKSAQMAGKELAEKLQNTTPLIYSSHFYKTLSYILKIQMNENAKIHAFANALPELNHNEIIGYEDNNKNFSVIMLKADDDLSAIKNRIKLTSKIIEGRGYPVFNIDIKGKDLYNKVFSTILLGNWISYYLAINRGIDPTPVDIIEELKKSL